MKAAVVRGVDRPRTFGDLLSTNHPTSGRCVFCKEYRNHDSEVKVRKYSTRHYACDSCIESRRNVVLPAVKKHERLQADLEAIRAGGAP